jgi:hypothetical protein
MHNLINFIYCEILSSKYKNISYVKGCLNGIMETTIQSFQNICHFCEDMLSLQNILWIFVHIFL